MMTRRRNLSIGEELSKDPGDGRPANTKFGGNMMCRVTIGSKGEDVSFRAEEMGCMLNLGILRMLALLKYIGSRNHVRYNHSDNHPSSFPCHGNQAPSDYDISDVQSNNCPNESPK